MVVLQAVEDLSFCQYKGWAASFSAAYQAAAKHISQTSILQ